MHFKSSRGYDVLHALSVISLGRAGKVQSSHYFSARSTALHGNCYIIYRPSDRSKSLKEGCTQAGRGELLLRFTWNLSKPIFYRPRTPIYIYNICGRGVESGRLWEHHFFVFFNRRIENEMVYHRFIGSEGVKKFVGG